MNNGKEMYRIYQYKIDKLSNSIDEIIDYGRLFDNAYTAYQYLSFLHDQLGNYLFKVQKVYRIDVWEIYGKKNKLLAVYTHTEKEARQLFHTLFNGESIVAMVKIDTVYFAQK